jgi:putative transposase
VTHRFIDVERRSHKIATMCRVLRVSRSGFYAWQARGVSERAASDLVLAARIAAIHSESDGTYGTPRVHAELRANGICVSRRRVARLMAEQGLEGVSRRKRRRSTTTPSDRPAAPDLIERRFGAATRPDQVWFADITYVPTWEGWLYVSLVVDAFSRRIVGWSMREGLEAELVVDALGMAATRRRPGAGAIHHSDRGAQYASTIFGRTLAESGLVASMGRRGSALDNAACESAIASFKTEFVHRRSFRSRNAAREQIFRWIEGWYNARRRHSSLGYLSPADYEELHANARGPCGPADPDQPALWEGALAGVGTPTHLSAHLSTKVR